MWRQGKISLIFVKEKINYDQIVQEYHLARAKALQLKKHTRQTNSS